MRAVIALALASLTMAPGCAQPPPPVTRWEKPGASYDQFLKDRYACIQEARMNVSNAFVYNGIGSGSSGQIISGGIFMSCLGARGYVESPTGFGPPASAVVATE